MPANNGQKNLLLNILEKINRKRIPELVLKTVFPKVKKKAPAFCQGNFYPIYQDVV